MTESSSQTAAASLSAKLLSDSRLARRAAKGDQRAFAAIYDRYGQNLYRFCLSILGNAEDAQDALQNTMVKTLRALPGEKRRIQLKPWLYRVAHNESIELLRSRREEARLDPELTVGGGELAETATARERLRRLIDDLGELPERQRAVLVMRELAGLSYAQIGEAVDTSAAVVRQTLYEARLNLRELETGREMSCEKVMRQLSEGDGRIIRRRDVQAHLRACRECREFRDAIAQRQRDLAALVPLPAAAATGLLHAALGAGSKGGSTLAGALGAGAGKMAATSTVAKSVATVAVVGAIGVSAADRGGLVDIGAPGGGENHSQQAARPDPEAEPPHVAHQASPTSEAGVAQAGRAAAKPAQSDVSARVPANPQTPAGSAKGAPASPPISEPPELPPASSHGQETAASHNAGRGRGSDSSSGNKGGQLGSSPKSQAAQKSKGPPSSSNAGGKAHPHPQPGGPPAKDEGPDKSHGAPFKPSQPPKDPGPPEDPDAHPSKEAR